MDKDAFSKLKPDEQWNYCDNCQVQTADAIARIDAYDATKADSDKAHADALAAIKAKLDDAVAKAAEDQAAAVAAVQAQLDAVTAANADLQQLVDDMGGTPLGQKLRLQKQIDDEAKKIAAADAAKIAAAEAKAKAEDDLAKIP